jgi:hypothetical protein
VPSFASTGIIPSSSIVIAVTCMPYALWKPRSRPRWPSPICSTEFRSTWSAC